MGNIRLVLWATLAALLYMNYEAWMHDYPATPAATSIEAGSAKSAHALGDSVPQAASGAADSSGAATPSATAAATTLGATVPSATAPAATPAAASDVPGLGTQAADSNAAPALLHVVTDVLDISINLRGG